MNNRMISCTAFVVLALLWLGFGAALVFNPGILDTVWQLFRSWPLVGQAVIALLTLPVVLGLWIWNTGLPFWLRLVIVIGLAGATLYAFFPKKQPGQTNPVSANS